MHICPDEINAAIAFVQTMTNGPVVYLNPAAWMRCACQWCKEIWRKA